MSDEHSLPVYECLSGEHMGVLWEFLLLIHISHQSHFHVAWWSRLANSSRLSVTPMLYSHNSLVFESRLTGTTEPGKW